MILVENFKLSQVILKLKSYISEQSGKGRNGITGVSPNPTEM